MVSFLLLIYIVESKVLNKDQHHSYLFQVLTNSPINTVMRWKMSYPASPVSPLGAKEEGILQQYFLLLSQFAFDKAKDLIVSSPAIFSHYARPYMSNGKRTLGDILYLGLWLVENGSSVRCICCRWTLCPKINFQPIRTCLTHTQFLGMTVGHVSFRWTCIALHSVLLVIHKTFCVCSAPFISRCVGSFHF